MGKKKKNDYWGVSNDEQMQFVESIGDLQSDDTPKIFKRAAGSNPNLDDSINDLISSTINGNIDSTDESSNDYWSDNNDPNDSYDNYWGESDNENDSINGFVSGPLEYHKNIDTDSSMVIHSSNQLSVYSTLRKITFENEYLKTLGKVVFTDGIAATTFDVYMVALSQYLAINVAEDDADLEMMLYIYSLSLKHPTAIYQTSTFVEKFGNVVEYNKDRFKFIAIGNEDELTACYAIDDESYKEFYSYIQTLKAEDRVRVFITLAYAVGQLNEAFFSDESEYIDRFINDDKINETDLFESAFLNDASTKTGELGDDEDTKISLYSTSEIHSLVRQTIMHLVGDDIEDTNNDDDDEDNEEDDEYDEVYDVSTDQAIDNPVPCPEDSNDLNVDNLLASNMTLVDNTPGPNNPEALRPPISSPAPTSTKLSVKPMNNESSDDDDLVVKVVRR